MKTIQRQIIFIKSRLSIRDLMIHDHTHGVAYATKEQLTGYLKEADAEIVQLESNLRSTLLETEQYREFLSEYRSLTDKIDVFEDMLKNQPLYDISKNVKKYRKRRKVLKNAFCRSYGILPSEIDFTLNLVL